MPRATRAKKQVDYNEDEEDKTGSSTAKPTKAENVTPSKTAAKRKAEPEVDEEPAEKPAKAAPKKRKTAKEKEEDAMPLAERTAVASLGKAMYIGAHVSAAGGEIALKFEVCNIFTYTHHRCPKCDSQCRPYRRQLFRSLPQVTAQMG